MKDDGDLNQNINRRGKNWGKGGFILGGMDRIIVEWNVHNERKWRVKGASKYWGLSFWVNEGKTKFENAVYESGLGGRLRIIFYMLGLCESWDHGENLK